MRHLPAIALLVLLITGAPAAGHGLYEASTIVTGMDLRSRPAGLLKVLSQVLVKVTGNPDMASDERLDAVDPVPLLRAIVYLDRMADQPKHDEQGTRDRPYDLIARFDPAGIDKLLRQWSEKPWAGPRPDILVLADIRPRRGNFYPLTADTDPDEQHRAALLTAADRLGLAVILPVTVGDLPSPPDPRLTPTLKGTVSWNDTDAGWVAAWSMEWLGVAHSWGTRGVSFDAAYRDAMAGAARILSGHKDPAR